MNNRANRGKSSVSFVVGDVAAMSTQAVVNAANKHLGKGHGVCGAIFAAAGAAKLEKACNRIGHCDTGKAVITPGFDLKADYIIHAVGPEWIDGNHDEHVLLYSCYSNALALAMEHNIHSIAFPLIAAGIYGFPKDQAWKEAISACYSFLVDHPDYCIDIVFVLRDDETLRMGRETLEMLTMGCIEDPSELDLREGTEAYNRGDYETAVKLYQRSADAGNITALSNLGYCHYYGRSIPVDKLKAKDCWEKAARHGDVCATYKLGDMYRNGDLAEDLSKAKTYYNEAYRLSHEHLRDLNEWPDICLRVAKYCRDEMTRGEYLDHLQEAMQGFSIRSKAGDRFAEKLYQEAKALFDKEIPEF